MDVGRETDAGAVRLGKTLLRGARFGALAVLDAESGAPLASRVGVATDADGTPLILVSGLSAHTGALLADPRCSLLLGEPGKGDPLAYPRVSLICRAQKVPAGAADRERCERRYLNRNPKAKLYAGLGDFSFFRLEMESASLNGGFGRAYRLARGDLIVSGPVVRDLAAVEQGALDHMNADHREAISSYARHFARSGAADWLMTGIDADGFDLAAGDASLRVFFPEPLADAGALRGTLVEMAKQAREALGKES